MALYFVLSVLYLNHAIGSIVSAIIKTGDNMNKFKNILANQDIAFGFLVTIVCCIPFLSLLK